MYVLVSPELLLSKRFYYILTWPTFRLYISLVVINKYYLVANWGKSFRPYYVQLFKVRLLLSLIVP
jgi:superfamily II DNA helicase RecQ